MKWQKRHDRRAWRGRLTKFDVLAAGRAYRARPDKVLGLYHGVDAVEDFDDLLARDDVEAVAIATPVSTRAPHNYERPRSSLGYPRLPSGRAVTAACGVVSPGCCKDGNSSRTLVRSPRISPTTLVVLRADFQHWPSMEGGLRRVLAARPNRIAYYPIAVSRSARLRDAAFRRRLVATPYNLGVPAATEAIVVPSL